MKNFKKWIVMLELLTASAFASNSPTNTSELGVVPYLLGSTNQAEIERLNTQRRAALEAAEKEFQTLLKKYPWARRMERYINQAESSLLRASAQELGAIKEERDRVRSELIELTDRPFKELNHRNSANVFATHQCRSEIFKLKQQITALAVETNNTAAMNSNRVFLAAELATANQKLKSLENERAELARLFNVVAPTDAEALKQKELQKKFAVLWGQLSDISATNVNIRKAQAELVRRQQEFALAISTNEPLREAKRKLERAVNESNGILSD
jgi:hypothetical protein